MVLDMKESLMDLESCIENSINYLNSEAAIQSIERDAYWPKWDSPWWHMSVLFEMGHANLIPRRVVDKIIHQMNAQYLRFFPIYEDEVVQEIDPYTKIPCHCQLGNMYQILRTIKSDIDTHIPWIRPWFIKYQLPDGGLNCEDEAYRHSKKSSIASSLPVFEAMMLCAEQSELSEEETLFLDQAAKYVIDHHLIYKTSGEMMDPDFIMLQFPRFYSYDVLRGLTFLVRWKAYRRSNTADAVIIEGFDLLQDKLSKEEHPQLRVERSDLSKTRTRNHISDGEWHYGAPADYFPLLKEVNTVGKVSPFLTREYDLAKARFDAL